MTTYLSRLEVHSRFMGRMMERCGVDPVQLAQQRLGLNMMQAARACMACELTESCRKWLDAAEREGIHEPPSFCPNAERFRHAEQAV
jgi:hypothetical protein